MNAYEALGLAPGASRDEAEAAYHRLLLVHHPDRHHNGDAGAVEAAETRTRGLNAAISSIRDEDRADGRSGGRTGGGGVAPAGADTPGVLICPVCGAAFADSKAIDDHALEVHHLRLRASDRRPYKARRRQPGRRRAHPTRRRRGRRGVAHLSLWVVGPPNLLAALLAGTVAAHLTAAPEFGAWIFALCLAPTLVLALGRDRP